MNVKPPRETGVSTCCSETCHWYFVKGKYLSSFINIRIQERNELVSEGALLFLVFFGGLFCFERDLVHGFSFTFFNESFSCF